jgi:hypothetical protein
MSGNVRDSYFQLTNQRAVKHALLLIRQACAITRVPFVPMTITCSLNMYVLLREDFPVTLSQISNILKNNGPMLRSFGLLAAKDFKNILAFRS